MTGSVRVLRRLLLILAGILVAALVAELALRMVITVPEVANPLYSFHDSDPALGWRGKRDARLQFRRPDFTALIEHGPDGWRRPEPAPPPNPARRVLFLGDSFTWGWGVNQGEVFTDRLQQRLPDTAIVNRGVNGFGTAQEYLLMQQELAAQRYDAVALLFFHNDLRDNTNHAQGKRPLFELDGDVLVARNQPARRLINPVRRFFKDHLRLYQLIDFQLGLLAQTPPGEEETAALGPNMSDIDYHDLPGAAVTMRLLVEMYRLSAAHGAQFVLVYVPHRSEVEKPVSDRPFVRAIHALIRDVAADHGIPLIDLTEPFTEQARRGRVLFYEHDGHWTPAGHEVAAQALRASRLFNREPAPAAPDGG